ncbi:MAG: fatty acid--CoA ligase family protein [Micavibrio sp.]|nr:fatty acid--CoA ligase family protein [Micavibrio sp.]
MTLASIMNEALKTTSAEPAIRFGDRHYEWGWMRFVADRLGDILQAASISADTPIGIIARNRPAFAASLLGCLRDSRSVVMIYAFQSAEAIATDIAQLNLAAIVADTQDWTEVVKDAARAAGTLAIAVDSNDHRPINLVPGLDRVGAGTHRESFAVPGIETLTSGTTGVPKRFLMSFDLISRSMVGENIVKVDTSGAAVAPAYIFLPFGNISGLYSYLPKAAAGHPSILAEKFSVSLWRDVVTTYRPMTVGLPPAGVQMVLAENVDPADLSSLKYVSSGAAGIDPLVHRAFEKRYDIPLLLSYGATEFGGPVTLMTYELRQAFGDDKFDSVGRPWAGAQLRVVDPVTWEPLAAGEEGLLEVITPRIGPDWIRTTDLAMIDEDGFIFHRGRADGAIMRGGFKIIPEMVVEALQKHPSIAAAAVVGLPDMRLGQVPVAAVELSPGSPAPSATELETHARRHLSATHVPVCFLIVDALPRTPSMKVSIPGVLALFTEQAKCEEA